MAARVGKTSACAIPARSALIVINPQNANTVYVGALGHAYGPNNERGVYESTDGGEHWTKILDQGPEKGIADLAIATDRPNIMFAATWHTQRPPWSTYAPIDGPGTGLFRSQDGGKSWTGLTGSGLPEGDGDAPQSLFRQTASAFTR